MMILNELRDSEIAKLGLNEAFLKLTQGESVHPELNDYCRPLKYSLEPEKFSPAGIDLVPLWEGNSTITGFYYDDGRPLFIKYEIEYIDEYEVVGRSVSEVIENLISEYIESEFEQEIRNALFL